MHLRLLPEAKNCDPLGLYQSPRPHVLFSPTPCRNQASCGAPAPTGVTETRPGDSPVWVAATGMEAWMTVTSRRAGWGPGTRGHCFFMSKGGAARVHVRKVVPPSRWKGKAGLTVSSPSHPSSVWGPPRPGPWLLLQPTLPAGNAPSRHGEGLPSEHVWRWWAQQGSEFWWDTVCRKPWAAFSQSPTSAEDSGDGPRAPTGTLARTRKSRTPGPGQEHGG